MPDKTTLNPFSVVGLSAYWTALPMGNLGKFYGNEVETDAE